MSFSIGCTPACQGSRGELPQVHKIPSARSLSNPLLFTLKINPSRCVESDASLVGAAKPGTRVWQGGVVSHTTAGKINAVVACAYPP